MKAELEKDLKALAKKHGMEISWSCLYCARKHETFGWPNTGDSYMISFTELTDAGKTKPRNVKS